MTWWDSLKEFFTPDESEADNSPPEFSRHSFRSFQLRRELVSVDKEKNHAMKAYAAEIFDAELLRYATERGEELDAELKKIDEDESEIRMLRLQAGLPNWPRTSGPS